MKIICLRWVNVLMHNALVREVRVKLIRVLKREPSGILRGKMDQQHHWRRDEKLTHTITTAASKKRHFARDR